MTPDRKVPANLYRGRACISEALQCNRDLHIPSWTYS